jgi:hypothetical protein
LNVIHIAEHTADFFSDSSRITGVIAPGNGDADQRGCAYPSYLPFAGLKTHNSATFVRDRVYTQPEIVMSRRAC